jgi:hypothetical protein
MNLGMSVWMGLTATAVAAWAQVSAGLHLAQDQFLPGESIPVSVRITNFSGQTLKLGRDNFWLQFLLEEKHGPSLASISNVPVAGAFDLDNAMIATKRLDLAPHYRSLRPGRYVLSSVLRIPDWGSFLELNPVEFDIFPGTVVWEQLFGVPNSIGTTGQPEFRRYALQQAFHLKQMKLYAAVTDPSGGRIHAVFPLGPVLTFSKPEKQLDRESNLHVLWQFGARSFYYCVIDPEGRLIARQTHDYAGGSRPVLATDGDGRILIRGGVRRRAINDLPEDQPLPAPDNQPSVPPVDPPTDVPSARPNTVRPGS